MVRNTFTHPSTRTSTWLSWKCIFVANELFPVPLKTPPVSGNFRTIMKLKGQTHLPLIACRHRQLGVTPIPPATKQTIGAWFLPRKIDFSAGL